MKNILKQLIPPVLWCFVRKLFVKEAPGITYSGKYSSFDEVLETNAESTNYNSQESTQDSLLTARIKFDLLKQGQCPSLDWDNCRLNLFPTFLSTINTDKQIKVFDIGGGLGTSFVDLKFSCPQIKTQYTIYELPELVAQGEEFSKAFPELNFTSEFPAKPESYDIALLGSSLQYFENYKEVIKSTCQLNPKHILLTDHPMGTVDTFICAQVNMKNRIIPRYVFNLNEIIALFKEKNYKLILKSINYYPFHNFSNYDGDYKKTQHYNVAFKKN